MTNTIKDTTQKDLPLGAISVRNVSIDYPIYNNIIIDRAREILGNLFPRLKPPSRRVLNGISLEVAPGETLGLIGVNGAGKTTLLKIISGMIPPSEGEVNVRGRLVALLAMGMGFRATFTGRENVRYGGLLLGMENVEIDALMPKIEEFSGLGPAFDQPYFTYSSGMKARLGFSLGSHVPSNILILDETLAAGDRRFVTRCYARLQEIRQEGRTILFVSHNMGEVARMTNRVVFLENGKVRYDGPTTEGLALYEDSLTRQLIESAKTEGAGAGLTWNGATLRPEMGFEDESGNPVHTLTVGMPCRLALTIHADADIGPSFIFLRIVEMNTGEQITYIMPKRWEALSREPDADQNVDIRAGETRVVWDVPHFVAAEGEFLIDLYIGPPVDARELDISAGRSWHGLTVFRASYGNAFLRGAMCRLELPVSQVSISHKPTSVTKVQAA